MKPQTFNSNYFRVKMFFGDDGFQNMFFYQPTFNMLDMLAHVAKVSNRNASEHSNLKSDKSCSVKSR